MRFAFPMRDRARRLRAEATVAERAAWALLRNRRILGYKFRRQYPLHGFYLDFYCPELKLAMEIDGPIHRTTEQHAYDANRAEALKHLGIHIARVPNDSVSVSTFEEILREHLSHTPPRNGPGRGTPTRRPPSPLRGEGDRG